MLTLSPYRISMFRQCAYKHMLAYELKMPKPVGPTPSSVRGRALHAAAEFALRRVIETNEAGVPRSELQHDVQELQEVAAFAFDNASAGFDEYVRDDGSVEETQGPPVDWDMHEANKESVRDGVLQSLVPAWLQCIEPNTNPAAIECSIVVALDDDLQLRGRLDVLPADGKLVDLKHTGGSNYTTVSDAVDDEQLTAYDLLYREATGSAPVCLGFDTLVVKRDIVKKIEQPRCDPRDDYDLAMFKEVARLVAHGIEAGYAAPAKKNSDWWCSAKWCQYWTVCPHGGAPKPAVFVV